MIKIMLRLTIAYRTAQLPNAGMVLFIKMMSNVTTKILTQTMPASTAKMPLVEMGLSAQMLKNVMIRMPIIMTPASITAKAQSAAMAGCMLGLTEGTKIVMMGTMITLMNALIPVLQPTVVMGSNGQAMKNVMMGILMIQMDAQQNAKTPHAATEFCVLMEAVNNVMMGKIIMIMQPAFPPALKISAGMGKS